ncbi:beta-1,2-xylosyltransferase RCN11 [Dendrobium catenatum]|uniref:Beta-(1,2)-xylosyltransferase n=1 Tax=Dendrobium catenatum TaxID=906689 RepID=A0A2I0VYR0_9ASPA|nr:beta-1,2-xylosyltransferase RCN11 [Dendrobium catenatum]XP_028555201.1 beta-1,2-xylosyltransferase RCN11 [Dendrobium catenatum]PKU68543.1 Beta-(1,2)-xylosyltransferase [Dendrobium catenatum]
MNRRQRALLIRSIVFLSVVNSLSLAFYFFLHPPTHPTPETLNSSVTTTSLKPWPFLPSFLPWNPSPKPPLRSCEAYFGNGFSRRIEAHGGGGWFRCFYSATLRSSICEGGRLRMDPSKIKMSVGGEGLKSVMGRREEEELPEFESGSFEVEGDGSNGSRAGGRVLDEEFLDRYVPQGAIHFHTMRGLMESMRFVEPGKLQCSQWIEEPTILVTRFEYANLFHTVTDWYSAYVSSRVTDLPNRPHLIFVDGHCKAPLEETWEALFTSVRYAKHFTGSVCFRHAILSPLGYETAMFKGLSESFICQGTTANNLKASPENHKTARLSEFGEMLRAAFGFPTDEISLKRPSTVHNVLFVRREDYLAHPRHGGKLEPRLSNEPEVFTAIQNWAANHTKCSLNVVNGLFAHMSMKEQILAIYEASVVIGAHGAGLTHLVSARSKTIALEIISSQYQRPHFSLISQWRGLEYHAINLAGSYVRPEMVIDELSSIVRSLGC